MRKKKQSKRTVLKLKVNVIGDTPNQTAELKRLLRLAMATIKLLNYKVEELAEYSEFPCCKGSDCEKCLMIPYSGDACVWKYWDEAEKLLEDKE